MYQYNVKEIGHLIKFERTYSKALEYYNKFLTIKKTAKTLYRIGREKEEGFNENGIPELYEVNSSIPLKWRVIMEPIGPV